MFISAWIGAAIAVFLNLVWINHPSWIDVVVYCALGWLIIPHLPHLWHAAGPTIVWFLFAGGVIYSLGAIVYAAQWPGKTAKILGYHEHFHAATLHIIAIWILVVGASTS